MRFYFDLCLLTITISTVQSIFSSPSAKDWLVEFHQRVEPDAAKRIAKRFAMVSRGPVRLPSCIAGDETLIRSSLGFE
jgi:hypothetical protein